MFTMFDNLSERNKSFTLIALGTIILLFTFGFLHKLLNTVIIVCGFYLIGMGLYKLDIHTKVMALIKKRQQ